MKRLLIVVLVAASAWFAYWFIASQGAKAAYEAWFDARRSEGWLAEYTSLDIKGFPNRVDAVFENIALADQDTGYAWSAPLFQIFALTYRPNHVIAAWDKQQTLATPFQKIEIASEQMQASLVLGASASLPLDRANFVTEAVALNSDAGWEVQAQALRLALHRTDADKNRYQFALQGEAVAPPQAWRNALLPETMSALTLDISAEFDRAWDISALEDARPQPTALTISTARAAWGELLLQAAGGVTIDAQGYPTGNVTLRAERWQDMMEMARQSGQFEPIALDALDQGLGLFASLSGSEENIDITLTFKRGQTFVGILPIGPAPQIVLR